MIGNVYLLTKTVARMFHAGKLPGCVVSDSLMDDVNSTPPAGQGPQVLPRIGRQAAGGLQGLGFAAGYLGGTADAAVFAEIIEMAEGFGGEDWREFLKQIRYGRPGEFFLFEHDPATGLGDPSRVNSEYLQSLRRPPRSKEVTLGYRLSRRVHDVAFTRGKALWGVMRRVFSRVDNSRILGPFSYWLERQAKQLGYGCQDCGITACLTALSMRWRVAQGSRNGPCGGSADGR